MRLASLSGLAIGAMCSALHVAGSRQERAPAAAPTTSAALARYEAAKEIFDYARVRATLGDDALVDPALEEGFRWSVRLAEAAASSGALTAIEAFQGHLDRMRDQLEAVRLLVATGRKREIDVNALRYFIADAEFRVAQAPAK